MGPPFPRALQSPRKSPGLKVTVQLSPVAAAPSTVGFRPEGNEGDTEGDTGGVRAPRALGQQEAALQTSSAAG